MRKDDQLIEIWAPEVPQEKIVAKLSLGADGAEMSIASRGDVLPPFLCEPKIEVLYGDGREPLTLAENRNFSRPVLSSAAFNVLQIKPRTLFWGVHLPSPNPEVLSVEFSTKGLNAWFTEQSVTFQETEAGGERFIVHKPQAKVIQLEQGLSLEIRQDVSISSHFLDEEELSIRRKPWLRLRYSQPTALDEAMSAVRKVVGFFEFVADGSLDLDMVYIYPDTQEESYEMVAQWIKGSHPPRGGHNLVWFEALRDHWQPHVRAWWDIYDRIPFALDSYRVCHRRPGQTLELRYLAIVGALEAFHRNIHHPGQMTLRMRLEDLSDRYSHVLFYLLPKADADKIVHTRDHIAHQTVFPNKSLIPVEHRWAWFRRLVTAFELCVVTQLRFSDEQVRGVSRNRQAAIESGLLGDWDFNI